MKFQNRYQAGELLAESLSNYKNQKDVLILALPRGGVPVAFPIAAKLHLPLDVLIVKKIGVPFHEELAMGAIALDMNPVLNDEIISESRISDDELMTLI